jgi:hypothetical protein
MLCFLCISVVGVITKTWLSLTSWQLRADMPWVCRGRQATLCPHLPRNPAQEVGRCVTAEIQETGAEIGTAPRPVLPHPWRIRTTFWCTAKGTSITQKHQRGKRLKKYFCMHRITNKHIPQSPRSKTAEWGNDHGYDSYSLSSNDSLPLQQNLKQNLQVCISLPRKPRSKILNLCYSTAGSNSRSTTSRTHGRR